MLSTALLIVSVALLNPPPQSQQSEPQHQHEMPMPGMDEHETGIMIGDWHVMQDANAILMFNHQGSDRGGDELKAPNWWMGMFSRNAGPGRLTISTMLSLDPATVTSEGYGELFQVGETHNGAPLIDRQHPHDFLMQLAAIWRLPLNDRLHLTLAGAPVGEPALGPVAFMHRRSAAEIPIAPLSHHTLDSTHIAMGVISAGVDSGPWMIETSVFNGREPDENRWDLMDPGSLDSWSARAWYRPSKAFAFQASYGYLASPEALEPGSVKRSTVSGSWLSESPTRFAAVTIALGHNSKVSGGYTAFLADATVGRDLNSFYGRFEALQVETELLATGVADSGGHANAPRDTVIAFTAGAVRDLWSWNGLKLGVGADVTFYGAPDALAGSYGSHPVSFHVFGRVRMPARFGRMWDHFMTSPDM